MTPGLQKRLIPIGSFIITTEVLPEKLARELSPRNRMIYDSKNYLYYYRLTPDGQFTGYRTSDKTMATFITNGPDGTLWFTEPNGKIGKLTHVAAAFSATGYEPKPRPSGA